MRGRPPDNNNDMDVPIHINRVAINFKIKKNFPLDLDRFFSQILNIFHLHLFIMILYLIIFPNLLQFSQKFYNFPKCCNRS